MRGKKDPIIDKILRRVAHRHSMSHRHLEVAWDQLWLSVKKAVQDRNMYKVLLHNFGTFEPQLLRVNTRIQKWIKMYREGTLDYDNLRYRFNYLWPIRQRLITESDEYRKRKRRINSNS